MSFATLKGPRRPHGSQTIASVGRRTSDRVSAPWPMSGPLEGRVLALEPMPAVPAPVEAAGALRHDPLQAHLARLGEDERALGLDRLAEEDVLDAGDEPRQRLPPVLQGLQANVLPVEPHEVECDIGGALAAALGQERLKVGAPVGAKHDRLAVDQGFVGAKGPNRLRDPRELVRVVRAVSGPDRNALALLAGKDAEAVVLHFMQPARSCGRIRNEGRIAGPDETGWKAPPRRRRGTPQHVFHVARAGEALGTPATPSWLI